MKITIDLDVLEKKRLNPTQYVYLYLKAVHKINAIDSISEEDLEMLEDEGYIKISDNGVVLRQVSLDLFKTLVEDNSMDWIEEWRQLFPLGVKMAGYAVRGDKQNCTKKMKSFMKKYPDFTKEDIFDATRAYIDDRRKDNWNYIKLAHYFIEKDGASSLAALCEDIKARGKSAKYDVMGESDDFSTFI